MMGLKAVVNDIEEVDENFRDLYTEKDEAWVLDVEASDGYELANTTGLKSALQKERDAARKARKKAEAGDEDLEQEVKRLRKELDNRSLSEQARKAIEAAGGRPRLLEPHVRARSKMIDGRAVVVDEDGNPEIGNDGNPKGIGELVKQLKQDDDFALAFKGNGASGGGGRGNQMKNNADGNSVRYVPNTPENISKYRNEISKGSVKVIKE